MTRLPPSVLARFNSASERRQERQQERERQGRHRPEVTREREAGTVKFYDPQRRFGFIAPDRSAPDLLVTAAALRFTDIETLRAGDRLSFHRAPSLGGKSDRALDIEPAPPFEPER